MEALKRMKNCRLLIFLVSKRTHLVQKSISPFKEIFSFLSGLHCFKWIYWIRAKQLERNKLIYVFRLNGSFQSEMRFGNSVTVVNKSIWVEFESFEFKLISWKVWIIFGYQTAVWLPFGLIAKLFGIDMQMLNAHICCKKSLLWLKHLVLYRVRFILLYKWIWKEFYLLTNRYWRCQIFQSSSSKRKPFPKLNNTNKHLFS